jgi:hypothetical protein
LYNELRALTTNAKTADVAHHVLHVSLMFLVLFSPCCTKGSPETLPNVEAGEAALDVRSTCVSDKQATNSAISNALLTKNLLRFA